MKAQSTFSELLQAYFTERLMTQRDASPYTIANYRDTFRLLIAFAHRTLKKVPPKLTLHDLDVPFVCRFLDYLEKERGNSPRSRNVRLAAIHSFFNYVAMQEPALGAIAQRVLTIKSKRYSRKPVDYLSRDEVEALLAMPDQGTWSGRRDRTLLLLTLQTGLRVSEVIGVRCQDVAFGAGAHVRCTGKGRKTRCIPLRKEITAALRLWLRERNAQPTEVLFPSARGRPMSRDGVEYLLAKHVAAARRRCPTLKSKRVTPHVLRHTTAMDLLEHGVDRSVIALWLGHESMETTQTYLHANLALKQRALAKTEPFTGQSRRYRPPDQLMAFLQSL
ncbi:MAG: tyrosine-type recombinase/integrase [Verrucomicrobiota bacterium]